MEKITELGYYGNVKFKLKISRLANQFFFISNLAEWHYSCRKDYNELWLKRTGPLNGVETKALATFKKIIPCYGFDKKGSYLGILFCQIVSENKIWGAVAARVKKSEYDPLRAIFKTFEPRFNQIWKQNHQSHTTVIKTALKQKNVQLFFKDLEKIFFGKLYNKTITIVVWISPRDGESTAAGGANIGENFVTLEIPALKSETWQLDYSISILGHEVAHMLFNTSGGRDLIDKAVKKSKLPELIKQLPLNTGNIINEWITDSFVPMGYLGQKYFQLSHTILNDHNIAKGIDALKDFLNGKYVEYYHHFSRYLIWQLYPYAAVYGIEKKPIDETYINTAIKILTRLLKERKIVRK